MRPGADDQTPISRWSVMRNAHDFEWIHAAGVAALVRAGVGRTIAIVPGAMADAKGWLPCATVLRTPLSVATVNRRGRAPSDNSPPGSAFTDEVDDVRALLSRLQGPFILLRFDELSLISFEGDLLEANRLAEHLRPDLRHNI
jgi:hypothetical protein